VEKGVLLVFQTQVMVPLKDQGLLILLLKALMLLNLSVLYSQKSKGGESKGV
jgi:hypothetical protein